MTYMTGKSNRELLGDLLWAMADTLGDIRVNRADRRTIHGCINTLKLISKNDERSKDLLQHGRFNQPEDFEAMSDYSNELQTR